MRCAAPVARHVGGGPVGDPERPARPVSFQALALVCYALGRNAVVAIGAPLVIFVSQASNYGIVYPIALLASPHTYGVIGLSLAVLCVALLGVGWHRTGGSFLR